ncbi:sodium:calcium antiporter [Candidatus Nomurabacteria bacterium]|nr:sodium:calcium antiporter [Candidatus Nomurabacteria bacterium]
MLNNLFIFIIALLLVIKGATMATKHAARLAKSFRLSEYTVGFIVVAIISILPETFIAINSAIENVPSFGLGMLFGSNIADLTLIFAILIFTAGRSLKVESKILKNHVVYPFILFLPLVLGLDGHYSRFEGVALIIIGAVFYYIALKNGHDGTAVPENNNNRAKSILMLLASMAVLIIGSHFTVNSATTLANSLGINPILVGMLIVGLGTTMPELFFSLKSVKKNDDSLAIGDILGTVLADATIVVGIIAIVNPFVFPQKIIYITGMFMVVASLVLFHFMTSGKTLTKKEALMLLIFWLVFVLVEFIVNK